MKDGAQGYFDGPITKSLLGGALPLSPSDNSDHYGNIGLATNNAPRGLMWQYGNYELNRLDIGRIDLAVLQDLGYQIKTYEGLPLFELSDSYTNITGTWASETLYGNYQANVISGLYGNDIMDGGAGIDTAKYTNAKSKYKLNFLSSANKSLTEVSGPEGFDTLISIERLKFSDASVAIDLDGNAGITAKILGAVLGKQSLTNKSYVGIGLHFLDAGWTYDNLAGLALDAAGAKTNDQVVSLLWTNVIGTKPSEADKAPFITLLENGMSAGALAHLAADTSLNTTNINLVGLAQTGIEYIPVS